MDEFILIFRHEDGLKVASPEQIQVWMKTNERLDGGHRRTEQTRRRQWLAFRG